MFRQRIPPSTIFPSLHLDDTNTKFIPIEAPPKVILVGPSRTSIQENDGGGRLHEDPSSQISQRAKESEKGESEEKAESSSELTDQGV